MELRKVMNHETLIILFPRVYIECYITPDLTKWKSETFRITQQTNIFYQKFTMVSNYTDNWIITLQATNRGDNGRDEKEICRLFDECSWFRSDLSTMTSVIVDTQ